MLRSFAKGFTYAEVANDCHISENTVRYHVKNLTSKTGMHNMAKIALEAVDKRVILPDMGILEHYQAIPPVPLGP